MSNAVLGRGKKEKDGEFYTFGEDIIAELSHYEPYFKDKVVLCNCDDPRVSEFFYYFATSFHHLGLKRLIATCYKHQDINLFSDNNSEQAVYIIYNGEFEDNFPDFSKLQVKPLKGDGDFRSEECLKLLEESDIVCTNPPFALFRELVSTVIKYDKKFLFIGPDSAIHYADFFPLIQSQQVWLGYNTVKKFKRPDGSTIQFGNVRWFTNLPNNRAADLLEPWKKYDETKYQKYDNLDAIDINKLDDIPVDYYGLMGVPDGFVPALDRAQFELVGVGCGDLGKKIGVTKNYRGRTDVALTNPDGTHKCPYSRIIIRRIKKDENR